MSLTNLQYETIKRIYDEKQRRHRLLLEARTAYVNEHVDGFREISDAISTLSVQNAKRLLDGDENALFDLRNMIQDLKLQKAALLQSSELPPDYLSLKYDCPDCKDTGYVNGKKCVCFKQAMVNILYDQSNIREFLETQNFDKVSDKYYKGKDLIHFHDTFEKTNNFVKNFNNDYQNIIFYGTVGTGKSFLSSCIAKSLIESGHSVIYFSSTALMDTLSKYSFDYKSKEELNDFYQDIYECDLLIIDDLGTELTNAFSVSRLFTCLNERFLRKKSIVISTNLSLEELRNRYTDRIFSRLTGNFIFCRLTGPDIRMIE